MVGESALSSGEAVSPDGEIARVVEPIDERLDGGVASAQGHRPGEPDDDEEFTVRRSALGDIAPPTLP
jgi:hypothetical protein